MDIYLTPLKKWLQLTVKMVAEVNTAHLFTQPHQNYNQNIEQSSLRAIRNQVEWKYDNYGIKETTSIQTGTRGRDAKRAGPTSTCVR